MRQDGKPGGAPPSGQAEKGRRKPRGFDSKPRR